MGGIAAAMLRALGSTMIFSAATIDQPGIMIADAVHGLWLGGRNRFDEVDTWLFVGTNPVVSKQFIGENPARQLHRAVERGTKLVVIDVRRTETARLAHVHLQPRPNEDATLIAAILHVLLRDGCVDDAFIRDNVDGVESLRRAVAPFTPEYVARRADVPLDDLLEAARAHRHRAPRWHRWRHRCQHDQLQQRRLVPAALHQVGARFLGPRGRSGRAAERARCRPTTPRPRRFRRFGRWALGTKLRVRGLDQTNAGLPTAALAEEILHAG